MSDIKETTEAVKEAEEEKKEEEKKPNFATIGEVFEDGVSLIFDDQEEKTPTEKHYKVNTGILFHGGDRVKILPDSGTYVVEYIVGNPKQDVPTGEVPTGGKENMALFKSSDEDYAMKWAYITGRLPLGGSMGQMLAKASNTDRDVKWVNAPEGVPTGGTTGQVLARNGSGLSWVNKYGLPSGGSNGQILVKYFSTDGEAKWANAPPSIPTGGTTGQYLAKGSSGPVWQNGPIGLPTGGKFGQFLQVGGSSYSPKVVWGGAPIPSYINDATNANQTLMFRYSGGKFYIALYNRYSPAWKQIQVI